MPILPPWTPSTTPTAPARGRHPPELAGRDPLCEKVRIALERVRLGRPTKSVLLIGLRGVGKTVLLDQFARDAEQAGLLVMRIEAPEGRSLPSILAPELRQALIRLSRVEKARDLARRALRGLAGFVGALKFEFEDLQVGLDLEPELAALITALHRANQHQLPIVLVGAGLPQLRGRTGKAKSYAERLFDFPEVASLVAIDARLALVNPARAEGVEFEDAALDRIIEVTRGYPYFLQEWGKHVWDAAAVSPITLTDVKTASESAVASLDESFFRVRLDRLTSSEKRYLRGMADLGPGPHRSGDIADKLDRKATSLGPVRSNLIAKGMIWSPSHGETAFTVPLFDKFMRRIMPGDGWLTD